jgi:hypothetical protein
MWDAVGRMPAWRLIWLSLLMALCFFAIVGLISDGSISDQTVNDFLKIAGTAIVTGTGGYAAGARVRKGLPKGDSAEPEAKPKLRRRAKP